MKNSVERENKGGSKEAHGWNEEVQEAIKRKKNAFREVCKIQSEENKNDYKRERNLTRKIVSRTMRSKR